MTQEVNNGFRHVLPIQIRFNDVDKFGHVNNTVYFQFYDTAKTDYIATVCKDVDWEQVAKCRCFSVMVFYDLVEHKSMPIPNAWRQAICQYDGLSNFQNLRKY